MNGRSDREAGRPESALVHWACKPRSCQWTEAFSVFLAESATLADQRMRRVTTTKNLSRNHKEGLPRAETTQITDGFRIGSKSQLVSFSYHQAWLTVVVWLLALPLVPIWALTPGDGNPVIQMGSAAGSRRYRPGSWGVVQVNAVNPTDESAELSAAVYFAGEPTLQYGRKIWVPAHSALASTCPVRIPNSLEAGASYMELISVPIDQADGSDVLGQSHMDAMSRARPLIVNDDPVVVGILGDFENPSPPGGESRFHKGVELTPPLPDDAVHDLVLAGRRALGLSRRVSTMNAWKIPADASCLDAFDVLVLCSNRLADDADATALVRSWVLGGGHLWILLDEMEQDSVANVLGDAFTSVIVDRVKLTEVKIESVRIGQEPGEATPVEFDEPVNFARVLPKDVTVTDSVDGWPAAFWQPFGAGTVFCTTLGPRAWFRPVSPDDPKSPTKGDELGIIARKPLRPFLEHCFSNRHAESLDLADFEPFLAQQIGYRILDQEVVAGILAVFCAALCVLGGWFWRVGRLDRLLWVGPLVALGTSLVFFAVATTARNSVPPTAAFWQRVTLEPGAATGQMCGLASLYNPKTGNSEMGATRGGRFVPDMTAMRGERRRMVWTDEGVWHWEGLELPPGIRTAPMEHVLTLDETVDCRARFGPSGLVGALDSSSFNGFGDALIAIPGRPALATRIRTDGSFASGPDDVLASGEFLADTWLSDVQRRRADVYRFLLNRPSEQIASSRPVLYFWSNPLDVGFKFPQANQLGSALVSVPVQMERPPEGTEVTVAAPFIPFRAIVGPDGNRPSVYSSFAREWAELSLAATDWLRFQLPESVLPIELSRAEILLNIRAPSRLVEILGLRDGTPVVVKEFVHPIGTYPIVLEDPGLLELDDRGGLTIAIRVGWEEAGVVDDYMSMASWKVESLEMNIVGKVQGE